MKKIIITILLIVLYINNADAQWIRMNAPGGGDIRAISKTNERVYVGTGLGDLYFSNINELGEYTWELMNFKENNSITDIIQVEDKLYVATYYGLWISNNDGEDWTIEKFGYEDFSVKKFKYANNTLYLASDRGISISTDNGITWEHFKIYEGDIEPDRGHGIYSMYVRNDTIVATSIGSSNYPTVGSCVWISYNAGQNWIDMTTEDIPYKQVNSEVIVGDTVFIATTYGVYKSSLKQIKWSKVYGLTDDDYRDILYDGDRLYAVALNGYFLYSEDEGYHWNYPNPLSTIKPTDYYPMKMLINNKDILLTTNEGLIKTSDRGNDWYEINDGLNSLAFTDIEIENGEMFLCVPINGIFSSTDRGTSWSDFNAGMKNKNVCSICKTDDALYSGAYIRGPLNFTTDNGQSWELLSKSLPQATYVFIKEYKDYLFVSGSGFYRVSKDGNTVDTLSYPEIFMKHFT